VVILCPNWFGGVSKTVDVSLLTSQRRSRFLGRDLGDGTATPSLIIYQNSPGISMTAIAEVHSPFSMLSIHQGLPVNRTVWAARSTPYSPTDYSSLDMRFGCLAPSGGLNLRQTAPSCSNSNSHYWDCLIVQFCFIAFGPFGLCLVILLFVKILLYVEDVYLAILLCLLVYILHKALLDLAF